MALSPGQRVGAYEIIGPLGRGGMGEVYRARDTRLKREVALKVLPSEVAADPDRLARFQREAEVLASLNHPHVAQLYGLEETPSSSSDQTARALVLELVDGPTLADRLAQGPLPLPDAIAIARQLAEALEYAHAQGIVHRDLKPANIKVGDAGPGEPPVVKVLDFGLAKALDPVRSPGSQANSPTMMSPAMTGTGVFLGTAGYMAPEQARGAIVDKRADIWAFGVVLWEMLTGRRLFESDTVSDTIASVLRAEPQWTALPTDTPAGVRRLLRRCLEKDRKKRLQDIGDARLELEDLTSADAAAPEPAPALPVRQPASRALWGLVVVLTLACAALAVIAVSQRFGTDGSENAALHWQFRMPAERLVAGGRTIALSPDGTTLAYAAAVPTGGRAIHVRRINELAAKILPGTEQAEELFFSPDGQWIGFSAGVLKKVSVNGGLPVAIAEMNAIAGAAWAPDGTIYFASATGPLWKIPSTGEKPVEVARPVGDIIAFYHPELSDDGRTVLVTATDAAGNARVLAIRLDTGEQTTVLDGAADPRLTGHDYLLVTQPGRVMAIRWDATRSATIGGLLPFLDGVATDLRFRSTLTFARRGALAFVPGGATGATKGRLLLVGPGSARTILPGDARGFWNPRVSPDATRVAFDSRQEDIFVANLKTGAATRLSFSKEEDETPVWSPDGKRVAYSSTRGSERLIFLRNADGSGQEEKAFGVPSTGHIHLRDWSADGSTLLYEFRPAGGINTDIRALDLSTGKDRPVVASPANETQARLSPNGRWLAYTSNDSGKNEIYVLAFPKGEGRWQVSTSGGVQAEWSRDGGRLFFRNGGRLHMSRVTSGDAFAALPPEPLFEDPGFDPASGGHAHWTLAGDQFLFFDGGEEALSSEIQVLLGWQSLLPGARR